MYKFSQRLPWATERNDITTHIGEQRALGHTLLDLTNSNPTSAFSSYPHSLLRKAFSEISDFAYDPDPKGLQAARMEIARYYEERNILLDENRIILTASTSEAYSMLFKLFCDAGDEILVPCPSYPLFEFLASLESVSVVPYELHYDGAWHIDFDHLQRQISRRTKAIVVVNPNNPTGTYLSDAECDALLSIASHRHLPLISDEVFMDFDILPRKTICRTLIGRDQVMSFSLNGLSKAAGMPQVKLAWIALNGRPSEVETVRARLELISDTYLSVGTPVQKQLGSLLQIGQAFQAEIRARLRENVHLLDESLRDTAAHRLHMDGGWSAVVQLPKTRTEENWTLSFLKEEKVVVQPGFYFDMPPGAFVVLSLLTEPAQFQEGLRRISANVRRNS